MGVKRSVSRASDRKKSLNKAVKIFSSILSADFGFLAEEAVRAEKAGVDGLHLDVMDGHFVPNLTLGPQTVAAIRRATPLFLDVHLMIYTPSKFIKNFIDAGANRVTIHFEATESVDDTLADIRKYGAEAGLAFCPDTSQEMVTRFISQVDLILIMSVEPGFGGQPFMPAVLKKIEYTQKMAKKLGCDLDIQVDGGINAETAARCIKAGANVLVSGNYLYKAPDMKAAVEALRGS